MQKYIKTSTNLLDYTYHDESTNSGEEKTMIDNTTNKILYEVTLGDKKLYAHYLATNSAGQWVMEVKNSSEIISVDKASVEEVLPYTLGIKFHNGGPKNIYSYFAPKGKFDLGFYMLNDSIVEVVCLDNKSRKATKDFKPSFKFVTEAIDYD